MAGIRSLLSCRADPSRVLHPCRWNSQRREIMDAFWQGCGITGYFWRAESTGVLVPPPPTTLGVETLWRRSAELGSRQPYEVRSRGHVNWY